MKKLFIAANLLIFISCSSTHQSQKLDSFDIDMEDSKASINWVTLENKGTASAVGIGVFRLPESIWQDKILTSPPGDRKVYAAYEKTISYPSRVSTLPALPLPYNTKASLR